METMKRFVAVANMVILPWVTAAPGSIPAASTRNISKTGRRDRERVHTSSEIWIRRDDFLDPGGDSSPPKLTSRKSLTIIAAMPDRPDKCALAGRARVDRCREQPAGATGESDEMDE